MATKKKPSKQTSPSKGSVSAATAAALAAEDTEALSMLRDSAKAVKDAQANLDAITRRRKAAKEVLAEAQARLTKVIDEITDPEKQMPLFKPRVADIETTAKSLPKPEPAKPAVPMPGPTAQAT